MSMVIIKYSIPLHNRAELLNGTLHSTVLGYKHVAVTIQTHVMKVNLPDAMTKLAPAGYYLVEQPQITPDPPKLRIYTVASTAEKYAATQGTFVLERPSGEPAYTGI